VGIGISNGVDCKMGVIVSRECCPEPEVADFF
jgi:hypothetical protein